MSNKLNFLLLVCHPISKITTWPFFYLYAVNFSNLQVGYHFFISAEKQINFYLGRKNKLIFISAEKTKAFLFRQKKNK
jgi:hypothetical protein